MVGQELLVEKSGEAKEISGEVDCVLVLYGLRVGVCTSLRMERLGSCWVRASPLGSVGCDWSQEGSWALKLPMMQLLGTVSRYSRWREKPLGVEDTGGM